MIICPQCHSVNEAQNTRCATCGAALGSEAVSDHDPYVGRLLADRFELASRVGSGELGVVYRGVDKTTGLEVAVKILLHPDIASTIGDRLLEAAASVTRVQHSKIAAVLEASRDQHGLCFIATEYQHGETLKSLLARTGPMDPKRAADILFQLCSALAPIHRLGRPHANLKPENIFLSDGDEGVDFVKVVDVGVADVFGVRQSMSGQVVIGTPKYFSPEQAFGQAVGLASDQFSLGVVGYQMLTGALPFFGATPDQLLAAIASATPISVSQRTPGVVLSPRMEAIINRLLSKQQQARFSDMRALAQELSAVIKGSQADRASQRAVQHAPSPGPARSFGPPDDNTIARAGDNLMDYEDEEDDETVIHAQASFDPGSFGLPPAGGQIADSATPVFEGQGIGGFSLSDPSGGGLGDMPPPVTVTSALDSEDLAAALSGALSKRAGGDVSRNNGGGAGTMPRPASSQAGGVPKPFDPFADLGSDFLSEFEGGSPPSDSVRGADASRQVSGHHREPPKPASANRAEAILSAINEELIESTNSQRAVKTAGDASSPLATVADFAAIAPSPVTAAEAQPRSPVRSAAPAGAVRTDPDEDRQRKLFLLLGLVVAIAAAVWWFVLREENSSRSRPPKATTAATRVETQPKAPTEPTVDSDKLPPLIPDIPVPEPEKPLQDERPVPLASPVVVVLDSAPSGARVMRGSKILGETPTRDTLKFHPKRTYTFEFDGYESVREQIDPLALVGRDKPFVLHVKLKKAAIHPKPSAVEPAPSFPTKVDKPEAVDKEKSRRKPRRRRGSTPKPRPVKEFRNPFD